VLESIAKIEVFVRQADKRFIRGTEISMLKGAVKVGERNAAIIISKEMAKLTAVKEWGSIKIRGFMHKKENFEMIRG